MALKIWASAGEVWFVILMTLTFEFIPLSMPLKVLSLN